MNEPNANTELLYCIEQYNSYLKAINKFIIAVENYSGKDYQEGYHKVVETFDQLRLGWEKHIPAETICADVSRNLDKQKKDYKTFIGSLVERRIQHLKPMDASYYTERIKGYFSNETDIDIGALKELRKIEEDMNG
ncbi:hypothetical protein FACS189493_3600 [Spirochaetia bacterium]|nr:hypothetical protein FACS189493_3600 [Spirochaetia bacterium]